MSGSGNTSNQGKYCDDGCCESHGLSCSLSVRFASGWFSLNFMSGVFLCVQKTLLLLAPPLMARVVRICRRREAPSCHVTEHLLVGSMNENPPNDHWEFCDTFRDWTSAQSTTTMRCSCLDDTAIVPAAKENLPLPLTHLWRKAVGASSMRIVGPLTQNCRRRSLLVRQWLKNKEFLPSSTLCMNSWLDRGVNHV